MIKRELYLEKIRRLINTEPIKIITGVRRSGKTYLLHSIKEELIERGISKENIFLISFESQKYNKIQKHKKFLAIFSMLLYPCYDASGAKRRYGYRSVGYYLRRIGGLNFCLSDVNYIF